MDTHKSLRPAMIGSAGKSIGRVYMAIAVVLSLLIAQSVAAASTARMALPDEFSAQSQRVTATGFGGRNKGTYALGNYRGEFRRNESRLGVFDPLYVKNSGKSSFTLREDAGRELLAAECYFNRGSVTLGVVTFDPKRLNYQCDFRKDGALIAARLLLGQPKRGTVKEKILARDMRRGEAIIDDVHFTFESVHNYVGSKFSSSSPVGYLVHAGDRLVAAVELTDVNPTVILATHADDDLRRTATIVALAIAVMRDPANSPLED